MKIGFSGTRDGMTGSQSQALRELLRPNFAEISEVHFGVCLGSDVEFIEIIRELRMPPAICTCTPLDYTCEGCVANRERDSFMTRPPPKIVAHPPYSIGSSLLAVHSLNWSHEVKAKKTYLGRNQQIVNDSDVLVATPKTEIEESRSGTWATIRWAIKKSKPVILVLPDGVTKGEIPWPSKKSVKTSKRN